VDERPHTGTVAHDRQVPPAHEPGQDSIAFAFSNA
jgi:hypothetical protein